MASIDELVQHGMNGMVFHSWEELAEQLWVSTPSQLA